MILVGESGQLKFMAVSSSRTYSCTVLHCMIGKVATIYSSIVSNWSTPAYPEAKGLLK